MARRTLKLEEGRENINEKLYLEDGFGLLFQFSLPDKLDRLCGCFGQVVEGYGMTETACVISALDKDDVLIGHVGAPSPSCGRRSEAVPSMGEQKSRTPRKL